MPFVIERKRFTVNVELVYIPEHRPPFQVTLQLEEGATVADALRKADIEALYPEVAHFPVGVFAKEVTRETLLKPGDRIEVYRPLKMDPKEKRRHRAAHKDE